MSEEEIEYTFEDVLVAHAESRKSKKYTGPKVPVDYGSEERIAEFSERGKEYCRWYKKKPLKL